MQEVLTISKKSAPNVLMTAFRHLCSSTTLYFVLAFRDAPTILISNRYSILSIPILLMSQRHPFDVPTNFLLHHAHLAHAPGRIFPMYAVSVMDHIQMENATISATGILDSVQPTKSAFKKEHAAKDAQWNPSTMSTYT
jgi:hypothetical protein